MNNFSEKSVPKRNLSLLPKLKSVTNDESFVSTYANFYWGEENGDHKMQINLTISVMNIKNGSVSSKEIITWPDNITENSLNVSSVENNTSHS